MLANSVNHAYNYAPGNTAYYTHVLHEIRFLLQLVDVNMQSRIKHSPHSYNRPLCNINDNNDYRSMHGRGNGDIKTPNTFLFSL